MLFHFFHCWQILDILLSDKHEICNLGVVSKIAVRSQPNLFRFENHSLQHVLSLENRKLLIIDYCKNLLSFVYFFLLGNNLSITWTLQLQRLRGLRNYILVDVKTDLYVFKIKISVHNTQVLWLRSAKKTLWINQVAPPQVCVSLTAHVWSWKSQSTTL